jgi:transposase InsO family protein
MVIKTITRAFKNFHPKIIHSDGGREFSSWDYYHTCEQHNVIVSHSKPGRPTHNACIESFFKTLKHETHLRKLVKSKTPEQIKTIVRKWIDFYNNKRVHSSLSLNGQWVTPRAFRNGKKNKIIRTK